MPSSPSTPTRCAIFYSWQSDLPNRTNRGFIAKALEDAVKAIRDDESVAVEPVVERDTDGVPGAPDIAATILAKIEEATAFVCDVSITSSEGKKPSPNPNVLFELGYAVKALGAKRVLMIMNTAYGGPELLPFDLKLKRVMTYQMQDDESERAPERRKLERALSDALRTILADTEAERKATAEPTPGAIARMSIRENRADQGSCVRKFMIFLVDELKKLDPRGRQDEGDENVIEALAATTDLVKEFGMVAEAVAEMNAAEVALALYKGFEYVIACYDVQPGLAGSYRETDFDFYKFLGHELFVTFFAFLLREDRWGIIAELLGYDIICPTARGGEDRSLPFGRISQEVPILDEVRARRINSRQISIRAATLKERHSNGELASVVPFAMFMDADYLLYLRSVVPETEGRMRYIWRPWSSLYLERHVPRYLVEAASTRTAARLAMVLGVPDIVTLRRRLASEAPILAHLYSHPSKWPHPPFLFAAPMAHFDWSSIGTLR